MIMPQARNMQVQRSRRVYPLDVLFRGQFNAHNRRAGVPARRFAYAGTEARAPECTLFKMPVRNQNETRFGLRPLADRD